MLCPVCNGPMWSNVAKKASGEFKSTAPDYKCKDKNCEGVIWPEKDDDTASHPPKPPKRTQAGPGAPDAEQPPVPETPKPAPPGVAAKDTGLVLLFEDCFKRVTKLCNLQNAAVGPDGINLTGENVASLTSTLYIARSRLIA